MYCRGLDGGKAIFDRGQRSIQVEIVYVNWLTHHFICGTYFIVG